MKTIKNIILLGVLLALSQITYGQISFSHAGGVAAYGAGDVSAPAAMYSPRLNFVELADEMTISIGSHIGGGLAFNSREGANSLALDIPIVAELNFGHAAHSDTESSFGGFIGAGYGISKIGDTSAFGSGSNDARGIVVNAGLRALIKEHSVGVRVSYMLNTKEGGKNVIGLGAFYTLK